MHSISFCNPKADEHSPWLRKLINTVAGFTYLLMQPLPMSSVVPKLEGKSNTVSTKSLNYLEERVIESNRRDSQERFLPRIHMEMRGPWEYRRRHCLSLIWINYDFFVLHIIHEKAHQCRQCNIVREPYTTRSVWQKRNRKINAFQNHHFRRPKAKPQNKPNIA